MIILCFCPDLKPDCSGLLTDGVLIGILVDSHGYLYSWYLTIAQFVDYSRRVRGILQVSLATFDGISYSIFTTERMLRVLSEDAIYAVVLYG